LDFTSPNTQCLPSSQLQGTVVMKNCAAKERGGRKREGAMLGYEGNADRKESGATHSKAVSTSIHQRTWEPLVLGPALAMDRSPGLVCLFLKFSSAIHQQKVVSIRHSSVGGATRRWRIFRRLTSELVAVDGDATCQEQNTCNDAGR
jgi:hypothetical protein